MTTTSVMRLKSADQTPSPAPFNYVGMHRYLIECATFESREVFTVESRVLAVLGALHEACNRHHFDIYAYCFLPAKLALIARGRSDDADMRGFLLSFRRDSDAALQPELGHPLWKKKYLERVLRRAEESRARACDLFQLPVQAGIAASALDYRFLGSFVLSPRSILSPRPSTTQPRRRFPPARTQGPRRQSAVRGGGRKSR